MGIFSFLSRDKKEQLDKSLEKTKTSVFNKLSRAIAGRSKVDDSFLDELEEILVTSDVGVDTTLKIIDRLQGRVARDKFLNAAELHEILRDEITALLEESNGNKEVRFDFEPGPEPYVIMVVGVNGVGKTTTIGKLAYHYKQAGKSVLLGAADTFRAAAISQLQVWAERVGVPIVNQKMGSDPAAVAFETLQAAKKRQS
jgi:fused signal recognition particle receptor